MKAHKVKLIAIIVLLATQLFAQSNPGMEMQDAIKKEQVISRQPSPSIRGRTSGMKNTGA